MKTTNALSWFEIPVADMKRATAFYEAVLGAKMKPTTTAGKQETLFPYEANAGVGGALILDERRKPGAGGITVYLPAKDGVEAAAARAQKAGGTVLAAKIDIGDPGFIALIVDSEGNHVGLHAER